MSQLPQVEIVVPVRNEECDLAPSIRRLAAYLRQSFPFTAQVTIADNGSTDDTWKVAQQLTRELGEGAQGAPGAPGARVDTPFVPPIDICAVHLGQPGRGRALNAIWANSDAKVLVYMDVDLSTDLNALLPLVAPLMSGHSDVSIGTRLAPGSRVARGPKREVISRCYNLLLHATLGVGFSDAQCGFKAIRADQARHLLPLVQDTAWFFDTELLVLAERAGLRIHEVPVDWVDDPDSRVDIAGTALADLRGIARIGYGLARGSIKVPLLRDDGAPGAPGAAGPRARLAWQLPRFISIGVASTLAYAVLYLALLTFLPALAANFVSLLLTAIGNTAANRRLTFGIRGRDGAAAHQARGMIAFATGLLLTSGALLALHAGDPHAGRAAELAVLVAANLVATMSRFVLYRAWVFGPNSHSERTVSSPLPIHSPGSTR
ncbi:MAG: sugar translocase [Actinomycetia bacterium]|nr:sugar translocase [Actinomycetes bacterium]